MNAIETMETEEYSGAQSSSKFIFSTISKDKNSVFSRLLYVFQNYLSVFGVVLILSHLLSIHCCILREDLNRAHIMSFLLIGFGVPALLVHLFTSNHMVVGNLRFGYLYSSLLLLQSELTCPGAGDLYSMGPENRTKYRIANFTELQGTMICVGLIHTLIGCTINRWVNLLKPVILTPTLIVAGLMVAKAVSKYQLTVECWWLFIPTGVVVMGLYYLSERQSLNTRYGSRTNVGKLYLAVIGCGLTWGACAVLSSIGIWSRNISARTDVFTGIFDYMDDYKIPYPFRWGLPTFKFKSIVIVCPAILVSILEVAADCYRRCNMAERTKGTFVKSLHDRVILEGACLLVSSLLGISVGVSVGEKSAPYRSTTSGKIIDSYGCILLILTAFIGTLCALFTVIPQPILVALTFVAVGSLVIEGIEMMSYIEFNKRNVYILGISIFLGIIIPELAEKMAEILAEKGEKPSYLTYLFSTGAFITALSSISLDFILPGGKPDEEINQKPIINRKVPPVSMINGNGSSNPKSSTIDVCGCITSFFD